jgi:hypothetical protein
METLTLPFTNISIFIYSFYGIIALSLLSVKSVNIAISNFKKGIDDA